jgi:hypothetical protein
MTLLPALPFIFKVGSRYIYVPSIGLAVLGGYIFHGVRQRFQGKRFLRALALAGLIIYLAANILAVGATSLQYHRTQRLVSSMMADLASSKIDFNRYQWVLFDHIPGRAVLYREMDYIFDYNNDAVASNDPVGGPVDIKRFAEDLAEKGKSFIVFDYRNGHLQEATAEYKSNE